MKTRLFNAAVLAMGLLAVGAAHAAPPATSVYNLAKLDLLQTCKTPVQQENGKLALENLKAFTSWKVKDFMVQFRPDALVWHSSLAGLLEAYPKLGAVVPFKMGQWDMSHQVEVLAFLAAHNDIDAYHVDPSRVDCIGDDSVMLITEFTGKQVLRDKTTGCITHAVDFGSPTKILIQFKDYQASSVDPVQRLVYREYSTLDDKASVDARVRLAEAAKGPSNVPADPAKCMTDAAILADFQNQMN